MTRMVSFQCGTQHRIENIHVHIRLQMPFTQTPERRRTWSHGAYLEIAANIGSQ